MIFGLTGTHGTGKTTLLQSVRSSGIHVDDSQLSRTAQAALGWDKLSKAQENVENMWLLQNSILQAMLERDKRIDESFARPVVVDRTPADAWAYTAMWLLRLGIDPLVDDDAIEYYDRLCEHSKLCYAGFIVVPPREEIPFVEESNRADLPSRQFVATTINNFLALNSLSRCTISELDPIRRAQEVTNFITYISQR